MRQLERARLAGLVEQALALAQQHGERERADLVDEARGEQSMHKLGAALRDEGRAVFLFQFRDILRSVTPLLVCHDNLVRPADLHLAPLQPKSPMNRTVLSNPLEGILLELFEQNAPNLYDSLTEMIIRTAYRYCKNNQVQTARLLGVSRNILRSQLKYLWLDWPC